jgi:hypothetical protein
MMAVSWLHVSLQSRGGREILHAVGLIAFLLTLADANQGVIP